MAKDWIPISAKTPRCEEVVRIAMKSGRSRRETVAILIDFWIWVVHQTPNGFLPGYKVEGLPIAIEGTDLQFWRAVVDEGWIRILTDGLQIPENRTTPFIEKGSRARLIKSRRQQKWRDKPSTCASTNVDASVAQEETKSSAKAPTYRRQKTEDQNTDIRSDTGTSLVGPADAGSSDLEKISEAELEHAAPLADALFKRTGYSGKDGGLFWQIAVLVKRGAVVESLAHSACEGARLNANRNPVGFVQRTLTETCQKQGKNLPAMLRQATLPKGFDRSPPAVSFADETLALAQALSRKDS